MATRTTRRRNAKMDLMTGMNKSKPPDLDLGLRGKGYFEQWTTLSLPDTGKNSSVDDEQQPTGSGSPETVLPGPPLKVPMEADDIDRPKIREGREASARKAESLRKVALQIRRLNPLLARRLMAASDEVIYDMLSTASLELAGDESNEVDDYQDNLGHGKIQFWGTEAARPTSLTRESSRREAQPTPPPTPPVGPGGGQPGGQPGGQLPGNALTRSIAEKIRRGQIKPIVGDVMRELRIPEPQAAKILRAAQNILKINPPSALAGSRVSASDEDDNDRDDRSEDPDEFEERDDRVDSGDREVCFRLPGREEWKRTIPKNPRQMILLLRKLKEAGAEVKVEGGEAESKIEFASRGASRSAAGTGGGGIKDINWNNTLKLVEQAIEGKYDRGAVGHILTSDYQRSMNLLKTGQRTSEDGQTVQPQGQTGQAAAGRVSNRRVARTEGDKPLKPQPTVGDQDGPVADGAGGFADRSKAPLQETMTADDVDRPTIRNNPEASRSMWSKFKGELNRRANQGGHWNDGRYTLDAKDYGNAVEVTASIVNRENLQMPVGTMMFTAIHDSPSGRYATVELNDSILENRSTEFTLSHPRHAARIAAQMVSEVIETAKDVLEGVTV
jgi:hypothetical protein